MPRGIKTESHNVDVQQPSPLILGEAVTPFAEKIILSDAPINKDYQAALAFAEEPVEVLVHESTDPNAEPVVEVWCEGVPQRFVRGHTVTCKRKFVEILARAMPYTVATREVRNSEGELVVETQKTKASRYPFSITDTNPRGSAWLRALMQEA